MDDESETRSSCNVMEKGVNKILNVIRYQQCFKFTRTPNRRPPPRAPPKTSRARRKNYLLSLQKPRTPNEIWQDVKYLSKLFSYFTPAEKCVLAQVCGVWRDVLYSCPGSWHGLIPVIYYNELRRMAELTPQKSPSDNASIIQLSVILSTDTNCSSSSSPPSPSAQATHMANGQNEESGSESSLAAIDAVRYNLYQSLDKREFDCICLFGATDADIIDFASKISCNVMKRITFGSIKCSSLTDKGLEIFLAALSQSIIWLELTGCNEITDSGLWTSLVPNLESLTILDCINIADETVAAATQMLPSLKELNLQAYHVTDASMAYFANTPAHENLKTLRLHHCWELSNQGILSLSHGLPNLTKLSLSGCSKITDDAVEVVAEQLRGLVQLDLSWCSRISDASLEYIACDLSDSLSQLILDRCLHVTDIGLGYIATMGQLNWLSLRWCPQIRDFGLQTICSMKSLKVLSVAGCPKLTINGLSCLVQMKQLQELELTNCPGATKELVSYLTDHLPSSCMIIV